MDSAQAEIFAASLKGQTIGGWLAGKKLGAGKSAVVLHATKSGRIGALKVFHPELVERYGEAIQLARIDREKSLIGVQHPNIVEILDGGKCSNSGCLYVVMEYLAFKNLRQVLENIPKENMRPIIAQIANAAIFLEERGLAHRDIKPENIGISDNFQEIVLFDLGVLRPFADGDLTDIDQRAFIGTLRYSSPEFLQRNEVDSEDGWRAVTIYQIGAVLHDLIMRKEIFSDDSNPFAVLVKAVLEKDPEIHGEDVELVRLAMHCLIKNPETRLELVSWSRFFEKTDKLQLVEDLKSKIASRQKYFRQANSEKVFNSEIARIRKRVFSDFCNTVTAETGNILNSSPYFPLRKTISEPENTELSSKLTIVFEKNENLGIHTHLLVQLSIAHHDENNGRPIYCILTGAAISDDELSVEHINCAEKLFVGTLEDFSCSTIINDYFLDKLEKMYEFFETYGENPVDYAELK